MKEIFKKTKETRRGFVILLAVTLTGIILSIALGAASIALKEMKFSTSARDTNDAFFAADTGIEYVLMNDKQPTSIYPAPGSEDEIITGLGSLGMSCAKVNITKEEVVVTGVTYISTTVISKGYNVGDASCDSTNPNRIEREIRATY